MIEILHFRYFASTVLIGQTPLWVFIQYKVLLICGDFFCQLPLTSWATLNILSSPNNYLFSLLNLLSHFLQPTRSSLFAFNPYVQL